MSEADEELKRLAARERAAELDEAQQKAAAANRERERAAHRERDAVASARSAPGFFGQVRFFFLALTAVIGLVVVVTLAIGGYEIPWRAVGVGAAALVVAGFALWLDAATWRGRLPFALEGDTRIDGDDPRQDEHVPWIAVSVRIHLSGGQSTPALSATLELLASRVNRAMRKDDEARFTPAQSWRVQGNEVCGETDKSLYTTRQLERWLRKEVRLLHRTCPVARVVVSAHYTGGSYWSPTPSSG